MMVDVCGSLFLQKEIYLFVKRILEFIKKYLKLYD